MKPRHGLEGDFNRKETSAFAGRLGERVAAPGVTVIDDGTLEGRRGSLTVDDEGTPTSRTVLIEDGILKGYLQDRLNARLMNVDPTGNGRRESFAHQPMPRMTNTFMLGGQHDPQEILASVKDGIYAVNFPAARSTSRLANLFLTALRLTGFRTAKLARRSKMSL